MNANKINIDTSTASNTRFDGKQKRVLDYIVTSGEFVAQIESKYSVPSRNKSSAMTTRYLDKGAVVSPTDGKFPIMTIAQTDWLKVQIIAPVKYFKQLRQGSRLTITPEKPFNNPVKMTVAIKDKSVDAASGTFSMIGYINNANNKIPSGILCSVGL